MQLIAADFNCLHHLITFTNGINYVFQFMVIPIMIMDAMTYLIPMQKCIYSFSQTLYKKIQLNKLGKNPMPGVGSGS